MMRARTLRRLAPQETQAPTLPRVRPLELRTYFPTSEADRRASLERIAPPPVLVTRPVSPVDRLLADLGLLHLRKRQQIYAGVTVTIDGVPFTEDHR